MTNGLQLTILGVGSPQIAYRGQSCPLLGSDGQKSGFDQQPSFAASGAGEENSQRPSELAGFQKRLSCMLELACTLPLPT